MLKTGRNLVLSLPAILCPPPFLHNTHIFPGIVFFYIFPSLLRLYDFVNLDKLYLLMLIGKVFHLLVNFIEKGKITC